MLWNGEKGEIVPADGIEQTDFPSFYHRLSTMFLNPPLSPTSPRAPWVTSTTSAEEFTSESGQHEAGAVDLLVVVPA